MKNINKAIIGLFLSFIMIGNIQGQANGQVEIIPLTGNAVFPESITKLPNDDLLVSCVGDGSIQRIDKDNKVTYFNQPHENGMISALGMAVDKKRNLLWVINLNYDPSKGYSRSNLKIFDLASGKLFKTISENYIAGAFFNEIRLDENGTAYISNTIAPNVYTATLDSKEAKVFATSPLLDNPDTTQPLHENGLAITPDGKYLLVSVMHRFMGGKGRIVRINMTTKEVVNVTLQGDVAVAAFAGSDGMYFYKKQLIMVNVFSSAGAVITAEFNNDYSVATLGIKNKFDGAFDRPSASIIRNGRFYMVNSQLNHIVDDKDGKLNTPPTFPFNIVSVPLDEFLK